MKNDIKLVKKLLKKGEDVNKAVSNCYPALYYCYTYEMVDLLLSYKADIRFVTPEGNSINLLLESEYFYWEKEKFMEEADLLFINVGKLTRKYNLIFTKKEVKLKLDNIWENYVEYVNQDARACWYCDDRIISAVMTFHNQGYKMSGTRKHMLYLLFMREDWPSKKYLECLLVLYGGAKKLNKYIVKYCSKLVIDVTKECEDIMLSFFKFMVCRGVVFNDYLDFNGMDEETTPRLKHLFKFFIKYEVKFSFSPIKHSTLKKKKKKMNHEDYTLLKEAYKMQVKIMTSPYYVKL